MQFFIENNLRFVMRIKEKVKVEIDGKEILIKNLAEEKVNKYLVLFILSHLFGMLIGYKAKRNKEIYRRFISHREEKSLFNLGQLVVITSFVDVIGVDISNF